MLVNIRLSPEMQRFVAGKVSEGVYPTADACVDALLREERREQLEAVYDAMGEGLSVFTGAGEVILVNAAMARLFGWTVEETRGDMKLLTELFELRSLDGAPLPVMDWPVGRVLRGQIVSGMEVIVRRRDTDQTWICNIAGQPVLDTEGRVKLAVMVTRDITAQKTARSELEERERFFRETLESIPGMMFTVSADGRCDYVSDQWMELTGASARDLMESAMLCVLHPDDQERTRVHWHAALQEGAEFAPEYRVRRRDGEYSWFKVRTRAVRDQAGAITRWFGTAVNIDDRKRVEAALAESEERFRTLAENMSPLPWMADERGEVFWYNQRWHEFTGVPLEEARGWG